MSGDDDRLKTVRAKLDAIPKDAERPEFARLVKEAYREYEPRLSSRTLGLIAWDLWQNRPKEPRP